MWRADKIVFDKSEVQFAREILISNNFTGETENQIFNTS